MIKPAVLNFVRAKAQEGADYTALYTQLKELASLDFDGEKKRLDAVKAARLKTEEEHKAAQEQVSQARFAVEAAQHERDKTTKEADTIIALATKKAKEIVDAAEVRREQLMVGWDEVIEDRKREVSSLDADIEKTKLALTSALNEYADLKTKHDALASKHDQLLGALAAMKSSL